MQIIFATLQTLAIGAAGGALFTILGIPMAWMLGALAACMTAAQFVPNIRIPRIFRAVLQPILGVMLGSFFTPGLLDDLSRWPGVLAFLALYVLVSLIFGLLYFRRIARYDITTSFFAAVPGGLADLTLIGASMGANIVLLGLIHSIRVLMTVVLMPFILSFFAASIGVVSARVPAPIGPADVGILVLCGVVGYGLARLLRIPAGATLGPLIVSAAVHMLGFTQSSPPTEMVNAVQVVLGAFIGARFVDLDWRHFRSALGHGIVWATGLIIISVIIAFACHHATGFGLPQLMLAFAPGGMAEMGLLTLALGIDVALVTTCHVARLVLVYMVVPFAARRVSENEEEKVRAADTGLNDD
ncbi:monooxygenase [Terrihabitans soli]|uniref:Monooxygenase n=1 Tax=Terrihabitans soli TaxID=708113 RepID=A0A6S6QXH1_9HYPH|nr:AbrB family transcriptional regulator [Terrihabitans soli]BCJ92235.1 monooxygenase [Terrihabitans soli]